MEIFINELSLHGQYPTPEVFIIAIKELIGIFIFIDEKIQTKQIFRDDILFYQRAVIDDNFIKSFENIRQKDLKQLFRSTVFNRPNLKKWKDEQLHSSDIIYTSESCTHQKNFVTDTSVAEIAERCLQREQRHILINFTESQFKGITSFEVIKDEKQKIKVECADSKNDFDKWLNLPTEIVQAFLTNTNLFERTKFIIQGATVFKEIETGYYWYLDNFHKNEFEIFNSTGKHIAVANLNGKFKLNSAKKGRTIDLT